jgi:dipeptidyl aminopeptidase/acylaminoacyl peptidase
MRTVSFIRRGVLALSTLACATVASAHCGPMLSTARFTASAAKRPISARDLIELRDIGDTTSENYGFPSRLALSPDGQAVAFSLIRADLDGNGYCVAIVVARVATGVAPIEVNTGGELLPESDNLRGYLTPTGTNIPVVPVWSPDGRRLAFLRRDAGRTRAWIVGAEGHGARAVTGDAADISGLAWSADGRRLVVASHPALALERRANEQEGRSGWLYDARMTPEYQAAPMLPAETPRVIEAVDLATSTVAPAAPADAARMPDDHAPGIPLAPAAQGTHGRRAWTEREGGGLVAPLLLFVTDRDGRKTACAGSWCTGGIVGLWWEATGRTLLVLRREGWNREDTVLYRWQPGRPAPQVVLRTQDVLQDCGRTGGILVCTRETASMPRRIEAIDLATGTARIVFEPNPEFAGLTLGQVRRVRASNHLGLPAWGDLVLPPGHQPGRKWPLIVVQYHSQGFLRGGTGDEYPIFLLAQRGFAVLSVERPPTFATAYPSIKTAFELNQMDLKDWAERRSILSSVEALVDAAIATGDVDGAKVGITGLSDGASTVRFAMINSRRFAAAALSTCCFDPLSVTTYDGIALSDTLRKMGFPGATQPDPEFWRPYSLAVSGKVTDAPLLMQLADREFISGLEAFQAMREYGKPVELYVFPDENHVKWQPVHRAAIYARTIDWFAFWLLGSKDPDPAKRAQYDRWDRMRAERGTGVRP